MFSHHITIGIVGHQSLDQKMDASHVIALKNHLLGLQNKYEKTMMLIVPFSMEFHSSTPIIKILQEMSIHYDIVLPIEKEAYEKSLPMDAVFDFQEVCRRALSVHSVDLYPGISLETFFIYAMDKRYQNFACQRLICEKSNEMIALWDGVVDYKIGSVSDAVRIRQKEFSLPVEIISTRCN